MQGPSLPRIHPRGESSTFPLHRREGQVWEGQVLLPLTGANILKKAKVQPLGFRKRMQQWPHCFSDTQNQNGREFSKNRLLYCKFSLLFIKQAPKTHALTLYLHL